MSIVEDSEHSDGAPTVEDTGIRVKDIAVAYEHSGYDRAGIIYVQQAGRDIGDVVKTIDEHLESRSEDDRSIHYC